MNLIFSAIGWFCLSVWYRNWNKIKKIRDEKYAGHFGMAGRVFFLNFIAGLGAIAMLGLVITVLVQWIKKSIVE